MRGATDEFALQLRVVAPGKSFTSLLNWGEVIIGEVLLDLAQLSTIKQEVVVTLPLQPIRYLNRFSMQTFVRIRQSWARGPVGDGRPAPASTVPGDCCGLPSWGPAPPHSVAERIRAVES